MFGLAAARRWLPDGISVNVVHPGHVATGLYAGEATPAERIQAALVRQRTPDEGADTAVWLASSEEARGLTGGYYQDRRAIRPSRRATDEGDQDRLWDLSMATTGLESR